MRIIIVTILMIWVSCVLGQEAKYDSAIISYYLARHKIYVSINGKEYAQDTIESKAFEGAENLNPFINKIHQFEKKDWLCIDIKSILAPNGGKAYLAQLRRKKE
jgi:hypothetical protein